MFASVAKVIIVGESVSALVALLLAAAAVGGVLVALLWPLHFKSQVDNAKYRAAV